MPQNPWLGGSSQGGSLHLPSFSLAFPTTNWCSWQLDRSQQVIAGAGGVRSESILGEMNGSGCGAVTQSDEYKRKKALDFGVC